MMHQRCSSAWYLGLLLSFVMGEGEWQYVRELHS
jgi:hypothetical protein